MAHGTSTAARTSPRPRKVLNSAKAITRPSSVSAIVVTAVNSSVCRHAFQNMASLARRRRLARPVNRSPWVSRLVLRKAIQIVRNTGYNDTASRLASIGTTSRAGASRWRHGVPAWRGLGRGRSAGPGGDVLLATDVEDTAITR